MDYRAVYGFPPAVPVARRFSVRRQLLFPVSDNYSSLRVASIKYVTEGLIVVGGQLQHTSDLFRWQLIRLHTIG
jgi:hypothetical protein